MLNFIRLQAHFPDGVNWTPTGVKGSFKYGIISSSVRIVVFSIGGSLPAGKASSSSS